MNPIGLDLGSYERFGFLKEMTIDFFAFVFYSDVVRVRVG